MGNDQFRSALDECLERIRQGTSVDDCLKAHPQFADRLSPFLRSAATLRGLGVPEPSASGMQRARENLLTRVAAGSGKETAVLRGMFKFANLSGFAVAAVFIAGMSLVAAAGPSIFGGGDSNVTEFRATVISAAPTLLYVQNNDNNQYAWLVLSNQTQYQDANGNAIARTDVHVRDKVSVRATPSTIGARFFDAQRIRLGHGGDPATPTVAPPEPTHAPTPVPEPTAPPTVAPTEKPATPRPTEKPATPKPTEKPAPPKPVTQEFWGTVLAMSDTSLTLQTDMGNVTVWVNGDTQYPAGHPFIGVKVWVVGNKQADGSFIGLKLTNKTIEFMGNVTSVDAGTFHVNADGTDKTVRTNGETSFPNGVPIVGDNVGVYAFKMGDGTYLAIKMDVKPMTFTGTIVEMVDPLTLKVDVGGTIKVVCYESAEVQGTLAVGATVYVEVDHTDAGTYFAGLVKVMG